MLVISHKELEPTVALIVVEGRVMIGPESEKIESIVRDLLANGYRAIIFDLTGVTHMDSTGMGRFIASLTMSMKNKAQLLLAGTGPKVREGFRVTRLDTVFKFYDDVESARAAIH